MWLRVPFTPYLRIPALYTNVHSNEGAGLGAGKVATGAWRLAAVPQGAIGAVWDWVGSTRTRGGCWQRSGSGSGSGKGTGRGSGVVMRGASTCIPVHPPTPPNHHHHPPVQPSSPLRLFWILFGWVGVRVRVRLLARGQLSLLAACRGTGGLGLGQCSAIHRRAVQRGQCSPPRSPRRLAVRCYAIHVESWGGSFKLSPMHGGCEFIRPLLLVEWGRMGGYV